MGSSDLKARITEHARATYPFAWCDACLGERFQASAAEIAEAASALAAEPGWQRRLRVCYGCRRTAEVLCPA